MTRPSWCPHSNCEWVTGGGDPEGSGVACAGKMPSPLNHGNDKNTHRLCLKPFDQTPSEFELNRTDVWYFGLVLKSLFENINKNEVNIMTDNIKDAPAPAPIPQTDPNPTPPINK